MPTGACHGLERSTLVAMAISAGAVASSRRTGYQSFSRRDCGLPIMFFTRATIRRAAIQRIYANRRTMRTCSNARRRAETAHQGRGMAIGNLAMKRWRKSVGALLAVKRTSQPSRANLASPPRAFDRCCGHDSLRSRSVPGNREKGAASEADQSGWRDCRGRRSRSREG